MAWMILKSCLMTSPLSQIWDRWDSHASLFYYKKVMIIRVPHIFIYPTIPECNSCLIHNVNGHLIGCYWSYTCCTMFVNMSLLEFEDAVTPNRLLILHLAVSRIKTLADGTHFMGMCVLAYHWYSILFDCVLHSSGAGGMNFPEEMKCLNNQWMISGLFFIYFCRHVNKKLNSISTYP